jgi:calcium-dependent protein kinase
VRKIIHRTTGMVRAARIVNKSLISLQEQERLCKEVEILKDLVHPNILSILEFYDDPKYFYFVTELCTGGELLDRIQEDGHFSEKKAAQVMK